MFFSFDWFQGYIEYFCELLDRDLLPIFVVLVYKVKVLELVLSS